MQLKIIVTGSNGQVGMELKELSISFTQFEFIFLSREQLAIDDRGSLEALFQEYNPSFFINCAAYTAVDKAEEEKEKAFLINGEAVGWIAEFCKEYHCRLIHISTDYVFSGSQTNALSEDAPTDPVNVYGASKLSGEQLALQHNPETIIIRTSWVYSYYGKNFVKTMMRLMQEKESISVVNDQIGSPTYAVDLALAVLHIIKSPQWVSGIYHFSNEGTISWFDFASEIKNRIQAGCAVHPVSSAQYPTPAKRPLFSVLDKSKIVTHYGIEIKNWRKSLQHCLNRLGY